MYNNQTALSVVIIEDDVNARDVLRAMIEETNVLTITGMAGSVKEGVPLLHTTEPDVAFLDVELTDGNSFELLDMLRVHGNLPYIIFTTAHDKYAIQAFKYSAFDYLLKPIIKEELLQSIQRLLESRKTNNYQQRIEDLMLYLRPANKLRFNTLNGFILIDPEEILFIHADNNYCEIYYSKDKREVISQNIGKLEETLPTAGFFRISRSIIVNLQYLTKVNTLNRDCTLIKGDETVNLKASLNRLWLLKRL